MAPTNPPRLARRIDRRQAIQERIKDLLLARNLAVGDPMPTELELSQQLEVSRTSLREAIKALQAVGIVEVRHGRGMYVGRMSLSALVDELAFHGRITLRDGRTGLAELAEVREALEGGLAQRLIGLSPAADLTELAAVTERMEAEAHGGTVSPETDRLFHEALFRPLGNALVGQLLGAFWDAYHQVEHVLGRPDEPPLVTARMHRDVYEAVARADRHATEAAMTAHFAGVRDRIERLAPQ